MTHVRKALPSDAAAIAALVNLAYRGDAAREGWTTESDLLDGQRTDPSYLSQILGAAEQSIEIALNSLGEIIGCVHLRREQDGTCYLGMLTVKPTLQRSGLGRRLLDHAESIARRWGCSLMRMTVITLRTELIAYYERRGYVRTGLKSPFPYGDDRFGLPKRPDLEFETLEKKVSSSGI